MKILYILVVGLLLQACGKHDDTNDTPAPDLLLGRWEQQSFTDISYDVTGAVIKSNIRDTSTSSVYVIFFSDGRYEEHYPDIKVWQTYTRSDKTLTFAVVPLTGPTLYVDLLIEELTATTLKTHFEENTPAGRRILDIVYKRP